MSQHRSMMSFMTSLRSFILLLNLPALCMYLVSLGLNPCSMEKNFQRSGNSLQTTMWKKDKVTNKAKFCKQWVKATYSRPPELSEHSSYGEENQLYLSLFSPIWTEAADHDEGIIPKHQELKQCSFWNVQKTRWMHIGEFTEHWLLS